MRAIAYPRTLALLTLVASASAQQPTPCYDFAFADTWAAKMQARHSLPGTGISVQRGITLYHEFTGSYRESTVVPIASASKLVSACVLMALVDAGKLSLDDTTGKHLATFTGDKGRITIRQLFAHTSGLPGQSILVSAKNITLAQAVDSIGRFTPLRARPGAEFYYGGVSMHVAGRICEIVSGRDWEDLVKLYLTGPLGVTTLDYQGLGATRNYRIAGSVQCRLTDYERILKMLLGGGVYRNRRVLSENAVRAILSDQTQGAKIVSTPAPDQRRYGIGCWLDRRGPNGEVLQVSSPGAFGFTPWLDLEHGSAGVVMIVSTYVRTRDDINALQASIRAELPFFGTGCYGIGTGLCQGHRLRLLTNSIPGAGNKTFAFVSDGAPTFADGLLLVAARPNILGWPLLGVRFHVALLPSPVVLGLRADASGRCTVPAAIPSGTRGIELYLQALWTGDGKCGRAGQTGATPGLALTIQ